MRFEDGTVGDQCIFFDEAQISGYELLERSDFDFVAKDYPGGDKAMCKIGPDGCENSNDCFCNYPVFWGYWTREAEQSAWMFSGVGPSDRVVRNGTLDGWSYGANGRPAPEQKAFTDICPKAAGAPAKAPDGDPSPPGSTSKPRAPSVSGSSSDDGGDASNDGAPNESPSAEVSVELKSSSPSGSPEARQRSDRDDQALARSGDDAPRNYLAFVGFAGAFALLAGGAYLMRRRRAQ